MAKALTREDLLYILQSVFRISEDKDNALKVIENGLYVKDVNKDLENHTNNENIHIDESIKNILNGFSISEETGLLLYNDSPITITQSTEEHINSETIHVTNEDKERWNSTLQDSKDFTIQKIDELEIYDVKIVNKLPELTENYPLPTTLYLLVNDEDCPEECSYIMYMYLQDKWAKLGITKQTLDKFVLKTEAEEAIKNSHIHNNKDIIDKFSESEKGNLLYNGYGIHENSVSDKDDNAIQVINNKLYVRSFDKEIQSMSTGGFIKYNLYNDEINDSGMYELKDSIDNYSLILVEYYYKPNNEDENPGCAKTAIIDTDILNYLYSKNVDYMLEYGYGILMSNSKIRMHDDKLFVDYYHNVNIYRITGIRRGDDNE